MASAWASSSHAQQQQQQQQEEEGQNQGSQGRRLRVAVVGCSHGELDRIYDAVAGQNVDLLICCGDFQAVRNEMDLACLQCPNKYKRMNAFYKYHKGEKKAPVLTVFIGGNHEASNYLQELFYGGWVAPGIFYLGCAGVYRIGGLRIAGLSGIYNENRYWKDFNRYEKPPYTPAAMRSCYHIRPLQVAQLGLLSGEVDVGLSHDWPRGIVEFGDKSSLLKKKPFLREDVESGKLGSPPAEFLLQHLKPKWWFSGHMHARFEATVQHDDARSTKFLALDKPIPGRNFIEILEIHSPNCGEGELSIEYDPEWLAILFATHEFLAERPSNIPPVEALKPFVENAKLAIPLDPQVLEVKPEWFIPTAQSFNGNASRRLNLEKQPHQLGNPQTDRLLAFLGLKHVPPVTIPALDQISAPAQTQHDENEVNVDDVDWEN